MTIEHRDVTGVPVSAQDFLERIGMVDVSTFADVPVTIETALGVPSVWAATNFLAGTLAGLPLEVFDRRARDGAKTRVRTGVAQVLHDAVNDEMSSFEWRKSAFEQVFTGGRAFTYIERQGGRVANLFPLDPRKMTVKASDDGRRREYHFNQGKGRARLVYQASEILDFPFMLKADMIGHRSPITQNKASIAMAIAAVKYGAKAFQSGGLPPVVMQAPMSNGASAQRASDDLAKTMRRLNSDDRAVMLLPAGHEMKPIGFNAEQLQLLELQRFCIEEVSRIYSLPPTFLQDLTHGTYSNTEQQDLHLVKHTIKRWVEQAEGEMNLKLFGRGSRRFVEFNVDGVLRGDIKTRMEAHATAIQNGIYTPAQAARIENQPVLPEADQLFIQGGTMPIDQTGSTTDDV